MPRHTDYPCNPASAAVQTEVPMTPASNRRHVLRALEALKRPIRSGAATHVFVSAN